MTSQQTTSSVESGDRLACSVELAQADGFWQLPEVELANRVQQRYYAVGGRQNTT
jgi:hypothetical protein